MGKYFFAGGTMPNRDLLEYFLPADLTQTHFWDVNGRQYTRTFDAWLERLDANRKECLEALEGGPTPATAALERWRMFLLFCSEVFGYRDGNEWMAFHYLFESLSVREVAGTATFLRPRPRGGRRFPGASRRGRFRDPANKKWAGRLPCRPTSSGFCYSGRTARAWGPLAPWPMSKVTRWFSSSDR